MTKLIHTVLFASLVTLGCDGPDDRTEARSVRQLADDAGIAVEDLTVRQPLDDESTDEGLQGMTLDEVKLPTDPAETFYCSPYEFQECRDTCGMFGQSCFVCQIADDGRPVFFCSGTPKKY